MKLFRKRFYPDENIELNDDIVFWDKKILVTKWKAIHPKPDLSHGISCFFMEEGLKISKFYKQDGSLLYWYCDVGDCIFDKAIDTFTFVDLLADVIIYPDGKVRVVDLAEAADVFEEGKIKQEHICKMLKHLDFLLEAIYSGEFAKMQKLLEEHE